MHQTPANLSFKFQYVNANGHTVGWRAQKGTLDPNVIQLSDAQLSYRAVIDSVSRDQRLVLTLDPTEPIPEDISKNLIQGRSLILQVSQATSLQLEREIDRISSWHLAEKNRQSLIQQGNGAAFRSCVCPECTSTVDVSLLNKTPYVYCRFCESVFQDNGPVVTRGEDYRLCDECEWFDRAQGYTEFYFYFLLYIYGFSYKRRHLCDTCVNRVFWKALLINFIFILGIFPALWMKIKSLTGRKPEFKELPKANALGKKGKVQAAAPYYNTLYARYPNHPGIMYSQSLGYLKAQDWQGGWTVLQQSLESCANYAPSVRMLNRLQEASTQSSAKA